MTALLAPSVYRHALDIAKRTEQSLSAVVADPTIRGLSQLDQLVMTAEQVAVALDEA
jgi:hypothetical protein